MVASQTSHLAYRLHFRMYKLKMDIHEALIACKIGQIPLVRFPL